MEGLQGVLWDMDGVLTSTGEFHFKAWSQTLSKHNVPFTREQFTATFGMNNAQILKILLTEAPSPDVVAAISDSKEQTFREAIKGHAQLLPGVLEWLKRLKDQGIGQAIASSAPPANIDALVRELGIGSYFDAIVSGDALPGKPNPAVFLKAAGLIGAAPEHCVVIEDAIAGVEAAKRAGMQCIAVTTTNPPQALKGADIIIERLDALSMDEIARLFLNTEE
jgi:beta-phosphoglucomutase family hydrolase